MDVKLVVIGGQQAGKEIPVPGPEFVIGRAPECHLRPRSDRISRRHCAILIEAGKASIRDFGSSNGTLVNGQRITEPRELKTGDELTIGPLRFEVRLSVQLGGKKKPKVQSIQEAAARSAENRPVDDDLDVSGWIDDEDGELDEQAFGQADQQQADTSGETTAPPAQPDTSRDAADRVLKRLFGDR